MKEDPPFEYTCHTAPPPGLGSQAERLTGLEPCAGCLRPVGGIAYRLTTGITLGLPAWPARSLICYACAPWAASPTA